MSGPAGDVLASGASAQVQGAALLAKEDPSLSPLVDAATGLDELAGWLEGLRKYDRAEFVYDSMQGGMSQKKAFKELAKLEKQLEAQPLESYVQAVLAVHGEAPPTSVSQITSDLTVACS